MFFQSYKEERNLSWKMKCHISLLLLFTHLPRYCCPNYWMSVADNIQKYVLPMTKNTRVYILRAIKCETWTVLVHLHV